GNITTGGMNSEAGGTGNGGDITLTSNAGAIDTTKGTVTSQIHQDSNGTGRAGTIVFTAKDNIQTASLDASAEKGDASSIQLTSNNGAINTTTGDLFTDSGSGNGGAIAFTANGNITTGGMNSEAGGTGNGGDITLTSNAGAIDITKLIGAGASTTQFTNDSTLYKAGDISINAASDLRVTGQIRSNSLRGSGGNISLTSGSTLSIVDGGFVNSQSNIDKGSENFKPEGNINLKAPSIFLDNGGRATVSIVGSGQGGNLIVNADELKLLNGGALASITRGVGNAGNINITTRRLLAQNTRPSSNIDINNIDQYRTGVTTIVQPLPQSIAFGSNDFQSGKGGDITINASESIELIGNRPGVFTPTVSQATVESFLNLSTGITTGTIGSGSAGKLDINTGKLTIRDGAGITTASISPASLPTLFPELVPSLVDKSTIFRSYVINSINSKLANISDAGKGGDLTVKADLFELQGEGGLATGTLSSSDAGNLTITANQAILRDGSVIAVSTLGSGKAGNLQMTTNQLSIRDGSRVGAGTAKAGFGGAVTINALESVELTGRSSLDNRVSSNLSTIAEQGSTGDAGDLKLVTRQLIVKNGAQVSAATFGTGRPGNIVVQDAALVSLDGGTISTTVNPEALIKNDTDDPSGKIDIQTRQLSLTNGSQISSATFSTGNAGSIFVQVADFVSLFKSSISTEATATGSAGILTIETPQLLLQERAKISAATISSTGGEIKLLGLNTLKVKNSQISASTQTGKAGNISVNAANSVLLTGGEGSLSVAATADGTAGNLNVQTGQFNISNGAQVNVSSHQGQAGNLDITANDLFLDQGRISAETAKSGLEGGANITLKISDFLQMKNESLISATALDQANGGNINIDTLFLIAFPPTGSKGSDIIANAERGNGGRIGITAQGIFDIEFRKQQTPLNDFTVSSKFGRSGQVEINRTVDPSRGLIELPINLVDPSQQISTACTPGTQQFQNTFVATGRGGLPISPTEPLQDSSTVSAWVRLRPKPENSANTTIEPQVTAISTTPKIAATQIVEASGWVIDRNGNIELVAQVPQLNPHSPWQTPASCPVSQGGVKYGKTSAAKASN
ncbi:beta strand repeat-containing protein, partial [Nostoc sp.]|uniref:beta strand repeat-containing protein n=1 Tax=Nostoc sp. TaxID=1180 RepID=UPI002FFA548F